jgi:hypothetical protein
MNLIVVHDRIVLNVGVDARIVSHRVAIFGPFFCSSSIMATVRHCGICERWIKGSCIGFMEII